MINGDGFFDRLTTTKHKSLFVFFYHPLAGNTLSFHWETGIFSQRILFLSFGGNTMCNVNFVEIIGNLGKSPEKVEPKKDKDAQKRTFVKMRVATNKKYKNAKGEVVSNTQWHTVYLNNKIADFALDNLQTGDKVRIIGEIRYSQWKDKEGVVHYFAAIYAKECLAFFNKSRTDETEEEDQAAMDESEAVSNSDDDIQDDGIPF